nr:hypothetical protein [bacterium]
MRKHVAKRMLIVSVLAAAFAASVIYFKFVSDMIYRESTSHLMEIYTQMNRSFHDLVSQNWDLMMDWVPHLEYAVEEDPDQAVAYIQGRKQQWGFTD